MLGTIIGGSLGHENELGGGPVRGALIGGGIGFVADALIIGSIGFFAIYRGGVVPTQNSQNRIKIENNVAESANFAKFTGNAFTVSKNTQDKTYYVDMFGVAIPEVGGEPTFAQVTYECDKAFYDKAFKYVDINYTYGTSGQLIGAENTYREPDFWFGGTQSDLAENDLLKQLVAITENQVVAKQFFTSAEHTNNVAAQLAKGQFEVTGIGHVNKDVENNAASFTIDMVDTTKELLTMKRITVEMPLTEEIEKDSQKAYDFYVNHIDECKISAKTVAKENVMTILDKDGQESAYAKLPTEHFEM